MLGGNPQSSTVSRAALSRVAIACALLPRPPTYLELRSVVAQPLWKKERKGFPA